MSVHDDGPEGLTFYDGDWPDILAEVARLAAKDGMRLEFIGDTDPENARIRLTRKPENPSRVTT
ncbi:MAG: hypothetical protein ACLP3C_17290 [Mycobacterium sp.]|uniref:hypothetical protein n=1 Tax=Mycobacterium sp. TaxID=1785 RepID=UPI003F95D7D1